MSFPGEAHDTRVGGPLRRALRVSIWIAALVAASLPCAAASDRRCAELSQASTSPEERSHSDWLLACTLTFGPDERPRFPALTEENASAIADRITATCSRRLADPARQGASLQTAQGREWLSSALELPPRSHRRWLTGCIRDLASISPGETRGDLASFLHQQGGIFDRRTQRFLHCRCPELEITLSFGSTEEGLPLSDSDRVTAVGPVSLALFQAD